MIQLPLNIDYTGKVVVVTGAGGLICGAMARAFAQSGAKVAALDLNEDAVKALADEVVYEMGLLGVECLRSEGYDTATWILLDFGSVIAHVFSRDDRDYYKLERLLPEGTEVDITDFLAQLDREAKG